ncbi:hypothetical protein T439DRAFT_326148 [Meredithblackwellia eburnea MCA 4105]
MSDYDWSEPVSQKLAIQLMGPVLFGWCFQMLLAGLAFRMGYEYCTRGKYSEDSRWNKLLLWSVMGLLLVCTVISMQQVIFFGTLQDRTLGGIWQFSVPGAMLPSLTVFISTMMQFSYARKAVYLIERRPLKIIFVAVTGLLMLVAFAFGVTSTVVQISYEYNFSQKMAPITAFNAVGTWLWCSCGADICVTTALCILLVQRMGGFRAQTDLVLRKLVWLTVETASYTTVLAIVGALTAVICQKVEVADVTNAFYGPLPSLYSIALIVSLDSRGRLGEEMRGSSLGAPGGSALPVSIRTRNSNQIYLSSTGPCDAQKQLSQISANEFRDIAEKVEQHKVRDKVDNEV